MKSSIYISFTGENSHKLNIPMGQGSLSIGTKGISLGKYDIWVDKDIPLNWNAFNELFTPAGKQEAQLYPCGDWPRFFHYSGSDQGFINWSSQRFIEEFYWFPLESTSANFTKANISRLFIHTDTNQIEISSGNKINTLILSGNLEEIIIKECTSKTFIFKPTLSKKETRPYQLPSFELKNAISIEIDNPLLGQSFDCKSLLKFTNVENLNLSGYLVNLDVLTELKNLQSIGLRFVPDLTGMPKLVSWEKLRSFIGWNIEENIGKRLKTELKELSKHKELKYSNVSKLKKKTWFISEYGIPFSSWENKNEKIATKEYKTCLKTIKKAKTEKEIYNAIVYFIKVINKLSNIETVEREDVGIAVNQLIESSKLNIPEDLIIEWFDEARDF